MFERDASLALSDARFLAEGKTFALASWAILLINGQISLFMWLLSTVISSCLY